MTVLMTALNEDQLGSARMILEVECFWSCMLYFVANNYQTLVFSWLMWGIYLKLYFGQIKYAGCNNSHILFSGLSMWICSIFMCDGYYGFHGSFVCIGRKLSLISPPGLLVSPGPMNSVSVLNE